MDNKKKSPVCSGADTKSFSNDEYTLAEVLELAKKVKGNYLIFSYLDALNREHYSVLFNEQKRALIAILKAGSNGLSVQNALYGRNPIGYITQKVHSIRKKLGYEIINSYKQNTDDKHVFYVADPSIKIIATGGR